MSSSCIKLTDFDKYYYAEVEKVFADDWGARSVCRQRPYKDLFMEWMTNNDRLSLERPTYIYLVVLGILDKLIKEKKEPCKDVIEKLAEKTQCAACFQSLDLA